MIENLDSNQTGFVPNMGTHVNIDLLIKEIRSKAKEDLCVIFIDFRSAYNTIIRDILYKRILDKNILERDEVFFLKYIHDLVYFKIGKKRYKLAYGVH